MSLNLLFLQVEEAAPAASDLSDIQMWGDNKRLQTQVHAIPKVLNLGLV